MNSTVVQSTYSFFKGLKYETQYLFIFDQNYNLLNSIEICNTKNKHSGVTDFSLFSKLKDYQNKKLLFFIVHNHPYASPEPSQGDFENYRVINHFFSFFNLELHDYLIFSRFGYFSFKKHNFLFPFKEHAFKSAGLNKKMHLEVDFSFDKINNEYSNLFNSKDFKFYIVTPKEIYCYNKFEFNDLIHFFESRSYFAIFYHGNDLFFEILNQLISPLDLVKI